MLDFKYIDLNWMRDCQRNLIHLPSKVSVKSFVQEKALTNQYSRQFKKNHLKLREFFWTFPLQMKKEISL